MIGGLISSISKGSGSLFAANFRSRGMTEIFDNQKTDWGDLSTAGNFSGASAGSESKTYKSGERMGKFAQKMLDITAINTGMGDIAGSVTNQIKPKEKPGGSPSAFDLGYQPNAMDDIDTGDPNNIDTPIDPGDDDYSIPEPYEYDTSDYDEALIQEGVGARSGVYLLPSRGGSYSGVNIPKAKRGGYIPNYRRNAGRRVLGSAGRSLKDVILGINDRINDFGKESIYNRLIIGGMGAQGLGGLLGEAVSPMVRTGGAAMILPRLEGDSSPQQLEWRQQRSREQDAEYKGIKFEPPQAGVPKSRNGIYAPRFYNGRM